MHFVVLYERLELQDCLVVVNLGVLVFSLVQLELGFPPDFLLGPYFEQLLVPAVLRVEIGLDRLHFKNLALFIVGGLGE